jgi:hypothetical protein
MSHLTLSLFMAVLLGGASALSGRLPGSERMYAGLYIFLCSLASTFAVGWLMHVIHQ